MILLLSSALFGVSSLILAVAIFIFAHNKAQRLWAVFNIFVAWWGFGLVMICLSGNSESRADLWWRFATFGGLFVPVIFAHFTVEFAGSRKKIILYFFYAQMVLLNVLNWLGLLRYRLLYFDSFYYPVSVDWTYHIITVSWILPCIYGHFVLYKALSDSPEERKIQIKYLFLASLLGFFTGGMTHFLFVYHAPVHPAWNILITVYVLVVSYGIFRRRLFKFDYAVRKGLAYTFLIGIVTGVYFSILFILEKVFQKEAGYNSDYSVIFIILAVLAAEPLRIRIQSWIDHLFFKGTLQSIAYERELLFKEVLKQDQMRAVSTLAAGMAHEIKNPITVIRTFAEFLPKKYEDAAFREKFSRLLMEETDRISGIARDLLLFARPSEPEIKPCDAGGIIKDITDLLRGDFVKHSVYLELCLASEPVLCLADPSQIKQAFLNIIMNAMDAMKPRGGELAITTASSPDYLTVEIKDGGCGIPEDKLRRIFDPFYTDKEGGTGLGLAITRSIVEKNRGKIEVESTVGRGTAFKILFPAPNQPVFHKAP